MSKTRLQKTFSILTKIAIVIGVLVAIMIGILKIAEKSKDSLRLGLQDYLLQATGHPSEISNLETAKLFPQIDFSMKGIVVRDKDAKSKTLITAGHARMSLSFWNTFLGIRRYNVLEATDVAFASGYVMPQKLTLKFMGISDIDPRGFLPPQFTMVGQYNGKPLAATAEMERHGKSNFSYGFDSTFPVTFKIGETEAVGQFVRGFTQVGFKGVAIVSGGIHGLFSTTDMTFEPLNITFEGTVADAPVSGTISQIEQELVVTLTPTSDDVKGLKKLESFAKSMRDDLGLGAADGNFKIVIEGLSVPPISPEKNKE